VSGVRPIPKRVLLVGPALYDTVVDSYARTLAPHYDVEIFDPTSSAPALLPLLGRGPYGTFNNAISTLSNLVLREPLAFALPRLRRHVAERQPEVILVTCIESLPPQAIHALRVASPRAKIFGVFSDHIANFGRGYFFTAEYDALFFKDRYIVDKLRDKLGSRHVFYLPQACDPELHHPVELTAEEQRFYGCELTIAGNAHSFRAAQLACLVGRDLKIWGKGPPAWLEHPIFAHHTNHYVAGIEKCKAMRAAKIVVNANHYAEIAGTNKRTFEVAAIGAFQITDTPALADVFEPDVEVATYSTMADMLERIDHYLARPEERAAMAARAAKRALAEHTYAHRWTAHLDALGLDVPAGFPASRATLACPAK
jgi:spore maturation protein CgeB